MRLAGGAGDTGPGGIAPADRRVALRLWVASRMASFSSQDRELKAAAATDGASLMETRDPALAGRLAERAAKLRASPVWGSAPREGVSAVLLEAALAIDPDVAGFGEAFLAPVRGGSGMPG